MWIYNLNSTLMWFEPTSTPTFLRQTLNAFFCRFSKFLPAIEIYKNNCKIGLWSSWFRNKMDDRAAECPTWRLDCLFKPEIFLRQFDMILRNTVGKKWRGSIELTPTITLNRGKGKSSNFYFCLINLIH